MRLVLDTNVVVSGLLWSGTPRTLMRSVQDGRVECFTSEPLLLELQLTLQYPKLAKRLGLINSSVEYLVDEYRAFAHIVNAVRIPSTSVDHDDDVVLGTALAAGVEAIVSGDMHLLSLGSYRDILILRPGEALAKVSY